jgi:predicted DNA-binding transcriptional regulator AlpA
MNTNLNACALLRLAQIILVIPVCKSSWWAGVKSGKYPPSRKLGTRTTVWLTSDIIELTEKLKAGHIPQPGDYTASNDQVGQVGAE